MIDEYLVVRVLLGRWPAGRPVDELALPASRRWRLLQAVHNPRGGQLSQLLAAVSPVEAVTEEVLGDVQRPSGAGLDDFGRGSHAPVLVAADQDIDQARSAFALGVVGDVPERRAVQALTEELESAVWETQDQTEVGGASQQDYLHAFAKARAAAAVGFAFEFDH